MPEINTKLSETDRLKELLYQSIRSPGLNPENTFLLLAALLEREFADNDDASRFFRFVAAKHPEGLGLAPSELQCIVEKFKHPHEVPPYNDKKIMARMKWMRERVRSLLSEGLADHGGDRTKQVDNVNLNQPKGGNSSTYTLKRLKRDNPRLAEQVIKGELSANAAAIEAGFRKKLTPFEQIVRLIPKLTKGEKNKIRGMLA